MQCQIKCYYSIDDKFCSLKSIFFILVFSSIIFSCRNAERKAEEPLAIEMETAIFQMAVQYFRPLPVINLDEYSPKDILLIELGKNLFYDKRLSQEQTISCASCHIIEQYGVDNLPLSPGDLGQSGLRNTPSVINAFLQFSQMWGATFDTVEDQVAGPIFNPLEMRIQDTLTIIRRIMQDDWYVKTFQEVFPGNKNSVNIETIKLAIGAFERTLVSPSRFDDYLQGERDALNKNEKKGIYSFVYRGCIPCHTGDLVGGQMAIKFPVYGHQQDHTGIENIDKGRYEDTGNYADMFIFKVPQLRNVEMTFPYFHSGSVTDLEEAVRIMGKSQLNISLEDEEVTNITAFLRALTGSIPEHALEDVR